MTFGTAQNPLTDGPHMAQVRIVNRGGHVKASAAVSFTVDSVAPTLVFGSSPQVGACADSGGTAFSGPAGTVSFTVSEIPSTAICTLGDLASGGPPITLPCLFSGPAAVGGYQFAVAFSDLLDGHLYQLTVTTTDEAGNRSTSSRSWRVDASVPIVTFNEPNGAPGFTSVVSEPDSRGQGLSTSVGSFTVADSVSAGGALGTICAIDGSPVTCAQGLYNLPLGMVEGMHAVTITAADCVGNAGSYRLAFYLDATAPAVTITETGPYPSGVVTLPVAADDGTNIEAIECALDVPDPTASFVPCADFVSPAPGFLPTVSGAGHFTALLELSGLPAGAHQLWYRALDHFDHASIPASVEFTNGD
jgi:hypothetical protein